MHEIFYYNSLFCNNRKCPSSKRPIAFVNSNKYYDEYFFRKEGECFCEDHAVDTIIMDDTTKTSILKMLTVSDIPANVKNLEYDVSGRIFLPYDRNESFFIRNIEPERVEVIYEGKQPVVQYWDYENTIEIYRYIESEQWVRNGLIVQYPSREEVEKNVVKLSKILPYESTKFWLEMKEDTIEKPIDIYVELQNGDMIFNNRKRKILCPERIGSYLIHQLNERLIEYGYLKSKKRNTYIPEIRSAILKFQKEMKIKVGFIDNTTLECLDLEIE